MDEPLLLLFKYRARIFLEQAVEDDVEIGGREADLAGLFFALVVLAHQIFDHCEIKAELAELVEVG